MSKLATIRQSLAENANVTVVGEQKKDHLMKPLYDLWTQEVEIFVAPTQGIYIPDALQGFMISLIPVKPLRFQNVRSCSNGKWEFGGLYFEEQVGSETPITRIAITDPDIELPPSFKDGMVEIEGGSAIRQRALWVFVYPDIVCAKRGADGDSRRYGTVSSPSSVNDAPPVGS